MWQMGLALLMLCGAAAVFRDRCIFGVSVVLLANWIANTAFVRATGDVDPWGIFLGVDYVSGVFTVAGIGFISGRFTFGSAAIALSYAVECIIHAAYGLSDQGPWAQYRYWWATFDIAVGQILFVLGWGIYERVRRATRARRRLPSYSSGPACGEIPAKPKEP